MTTTPSFSYEEYFKRRMKVASVSLTPDIYDWYQHMQRSHAVFFDEARAAWLVFRYDDVQQVLRDTHIFSSQRDLSPDGKVDAVVNGSLLGMDPPRHRQLRALVSQAFTPRVVARLEPRITELAFSLLDEMSTKEEVDIVDDFAFPLPLTVISELLVIPNADQDNFRQWAAEVVGIDYKIRRAASQKLAHYFRELIKQRSQDDLRDDLISNLIQAEVDGERLPEDDIIALCILLLNAGHETTVGLISNSIVCFDEHPDALQQLIAQPELLPSAIEEVLRYRGIVHTITRLATVDTVLGGQEIKAGDQVLPLFASANFDEAQFPNAETFDIRRSPNRHLSFGYGIHFCLGAPLARLETRIALAALLARFPNIKRIQSIPLELKPSSFIYGLKHIPVTLT